MTIHWVYADKRLCETLLVNNTKQERSRSGSIEMCLNWHYCELERNTINATFPLRTGYDLPFIWMNTDKMYSNDKTAGKAFSRYFEICWISNPNKWFCLISFYCCCFCNRRNLCVWSIFRWAKKGTSSNWCVIYDHFYNYNHIMDGYWFLG